MPRLMRAKAMHSPDDVERLAREIAKERGLDPDQMMSSEVLYEIDGMWAHPTLPFFPAWHRYQKFAQDMLNALDRFTA